MAHAIRHLRCVWWWLVLAGLVAPAIGLAQAPRAPEQAGRFTVFSAQPLKDLVFVPRAAAPKQALVFYPTARSPRYDYRTAMPLRFTDATTGALVAEATIPPDIRDALLFFTAIEPAPPTGLRYRIAVLDDSPAVRAVGALNIINLSGLALSGTVGSSAVTLQAGLNPPIALASSVPVALRATLKGKAYPSYSGTVKLGRGERALLILFPPFNKGSLEVQSRLLVDNPSAPAGPSGAPVRK